MTRHKYGAKATTVDGHTFPSKKEAARYQELKLLAKAGEIALLEIQPAYPLTVWAPDGRLVRVGVYYADFRYMERGNGSVTEDVKGVLTPVYRLKKRMVEAQYGIEIREI